MAGLFSIDPRDPLPLYAQLERSIKLAVAAGRLTPGDRLPTVRQLAVDLRLNANTVARVYAELERQGVVSTRRGSGTFVEAAEPPPASRAKRAALLRTLAARFLAEGASHGFTPEELLQELHSHHQQLKKPSPKK